MSNRNPILEYMIFKHPDAFKEWQMENPKIVVFNTQFIADDDYIKCCVVYTVQKDNPDEKPVDEELVEKIKEALDPVDPNPKLN